MDKGISFPFQKYQGTGNDFVIINDFDGTLLTQLDEEKIKTICDRRFGIGADGFIAVLEEKPGSYCMVYFNSDGRESTMCGNGGRCFAAYLFEKKLVNSNEIHFLAIDGHHVAYIQEDENVSLHMKDPVIYESGQNLMWLDTGSPHVVKRMDQKIELLDIKSEGAKIRYATKYAPGGVNANFVSQEDGQFYLRTYERGVEDETLSCGTGACAAAVSVAHWQNLSGDQTVALNTPGGMLTVSMNISDGIFSNIVLTGPAKKVFDGTWRFM